ncbi:hypothetical protein FOMA001_g10551 [Fusarium oxysporum f. sp. matthiolae]|nr:hypothetical protein FOMA001_g10551 [Fusarium oxysporum f. sp. matthiolae]
MTTRRRLPPKNSWSDFLFDQVFCRSKPPTWNALFFLQLYRGFKEFWQDTCAPLGPFDVRFSRQIGNYIQIAFNSDHTKEVGTSHAQGTWYHASHPSSRSSTGLLISPRRALKKIYLYRLFTVSALILKVFLLALPP